MDPKNKEELVEEYEEALLRLMMNEYMEQEGDRLLQEMEALEASGGLPEVPPELDARCRKMIADARANGRRKEMVIGFFKTAGRWAAILMITIGLLTSLVFSVEAIRIPVVNFIIEQHEKYAAIIVSKDDMTTEPNNVSVNKPEKSTLEAMVPDSFVMSNSIVSDSGSFTYLFQNGSGASISFIARKSNDNSLNIDAENAVVERMAISGCNGVLVRKENILTFMWTLPDSDMVFTVDSSDVDYVVFWDTVTALIDYSKSLYNDA